MSKPSIKNVAVVGTGVIGRSWIQVFARGGCLVKVFDQDRSQSKRAMAWFEGDVKLLRQRKEIKKKEAKARLDRVTVAESLDEALDGVGYVQESGPEDLEVKRALFGELDQVAAPETVLGSSTSALDMTRIAAGLKGAGRCIVAHPVNPPHVIPVVEVLGGDLTEARTVRKTVRFLREVGQSPVLMYRYTPGFLLNRMQAALIREAVDLFERGVADVESIDTCIRDGLGLRWALMGPFGVANTNADGGVKEYFTRFRNAYHGLWDDLQTGTRFTDELVEQLGKQTSAMARAPHETQRAWRDRMVTAIRSLKDADPLPVRRGK